MENLTNDTMTRLRMMEERIMEMKKSGSRSPSRGSRSHLRLKGQKGTHY